MSSRLSQRRTIPYAERDELCHGLPFTRFQFSLTQIVWQLGRVAGISDSDHGHRFKSRRNSQVGARLFYIESCHLVHDQVQALWPVPRD